MGAWGFLHGNNELSEDQIREYANYLIKDLIESNIFQKKEE
jgi:hypothetical protein